MVDKSQTQVNYVIEHFEDELSDWTLSEYVHMVLVLSNLYETCPAPNNQLILTNFKFTNKLGLKSLKEDELNSLKNTQTFEKIRSKYPKRCLVSQLSLIELTAKESPDCSHLQDDT